MKLQKSQHTFSNKKRAIRRRRLTIIGAGLVSVAAIVSAVIFIGSQFLTHQQIQTSPESQSSNSEVLQSENSSTSDASSQISSEESQVESVSSDKNETSSTPVVSVDPNGPDYQKKYPDLYVTDRPKMQVLDDDDKVVYLTFDDGPSENTGEILDILKEKNAKATFFVTGNNQEHDDMIKRAFSEGHSIGLHTYTHDYATVYASEDAYFADLQKVSDLVESITGTKSMIIRFPGGSSNTVSAKYVKGLMTTLTKAVRDKGYQYFDWNCDSTDASGNNVPVEKLVSNATSCTANHVDILMHDTDAKDTTVQALPQIIDYYRSQGYTFKGLTVDSVAAHHGVNN